ncbi:hypothetical protein Sjap_008010 [Stephania japonica]|uniref:PROP1-like PPR domain-containing protein n=1 Tax=Stephania japonica TaxID=461633 RepID=A0AAP0JPK5_9MAGN
MFPSPRIYEVITRFRQGKVLNFCNGVMYKCFCNVGESDKLPDWVKPSSAADSQEDDFVIPSNMNWVGGLKAPDEKFDSKHGSFGIVDNDVAIVTRILMGDFAMPEDVVQALNGCDSCPSNSLVDKMLKRFSNDWVCAFGLFKWAQTNIRYKHSADAYDSMVDILGKLKQFDIMWGLVEEMVKVEGLISMRTMSKIMRRLAGAGRWVDAVAVFREVERYGLTRDILCMNLLLDTLCKERCVEHAQDVFLEFKNVIPPDQHTFNILIHGWCKARRLDNARSIMEDMGDHGFLPCVISYTSFIEAYCRDKDFRKVDSLLNEMQENGCPPNIVTYTIVMHSLGKAKETNEAMEIYEKMKRNSCVPDTSFFNSLIYILSKAGRLQDAHKIYEEMSRSGSSPNVTTYNTMIAAACEHSQENSALKLLHEMEESGCKADLKTYAPLLKMCCRKKWIKVLSYLLNDMVRKDISLDLGTYSIIIHGLCKSEQLEKACQFFEEVVLKGLIPFNSTFNLLVDVLERKKMEEAKRRVQDLMMQAENSEKSCRSVSFV